jgi:DNA uptake protein ComE-like DNA-binding protein
MAYALRYIAVKERRNNMRIPSHRLSTLAMLILACTPALAQPTPEAPLPEAGNGERLFGMEFEFAGSGNRILHFEEMPFENFEKLMRVVVEHQGGNPEHIRKVTFMKETTNLERYPSGERELFRAEWVDPRGRKWMIEPEFVASTGYDGYELVTPPMDDTRSLGTLLDKIKASGLVREGLKSGVHLTIDGRKLIAPNGDARALTNLIMLHENMEPTLRRLFNPVRGGGHANRFARSLAVDHPDLMREIDALAPEERTRERLEALFNARNGREATLHEVDPMDPNSLKKPWKYRALNLAKVLNVNPVHDGNMGAVEFRMFDLAALENPELHRLEAETYRRMVRHAETLAANGVDVTYTPRAPMPAGDNPTFYNTPEDPTEAREEASRMLREIGVDPAEFKSVFETERFQPRTLPSEGEFRGMLEAIPTDARTHNGKAFSYGFELEGRGNGLTAIMRPTDAEVDARWDSMNDTERRAHFDRVVTSDSAVKSHFKPDPALWWLDPYWYVEGTGNWEIHSKVFESVDEIIRGMREAKNLTGKSGKGFHLHMRDNAPDWEMLKAKGSQFADFMERASNWVWLERARRLGSMTSLKSWSNARSSNSDIENLSKLSNSGRATIRTQFRLQGGNNIDVEIRGFTKYVDDIESLAKIMTEALKTGNFGPWKHTDTRLPSTGQGAADKSILLVDHVEKYLREVEGKEMSPEMRRIVTGMQTDFLNKAGGRARSLPGNLGAPLMDWDKDMSLPEDVRRALKFERETYLRKVVAMARDIMAGEKGFGTDLELANEERLAKELGITEEEARKLIEYRRARSAGLKPEDVVRAMATGEDAERLARLEAMKINEADERTLRNRLDLSEAEARRVHESARAHDATTSMERAGVTENRILDAIDRGDVLDISSTELRAEELADRLRISEESARKIIEHRGGFELNGEADYRAAGVEANRVEAVLDVATRTYDLNTANAEELRSMGVTDADAERILGAREGFEYRRYDELSKAGVSEEARNTLKANRLINMAKLNSLSAAELVSSGGISAEEAAKIVEFRSGERDLSSAEAMRSLLGARGESLHERAVNGLDLSVASAEDMTRAGLTQAEAEALINHRTRRNIGRDGSYTWSRFNPDNAARELLEANVITEAEAEAIRLNASDRTIENANAETLVKRFGLTEAEASEMLRLRDARDMSTREALLESGLSEAKADRILKSTSALDPRTASRADLVERSGLSEAAVDRLLRITGTEAEGTSALNLLEVTAEELRERGFSETEAKRLIEIREAAKAIPGLNYKEIEKQIRFKVKTWAKETQLSEALKRSLLPKITKANPVADTAENRANGTFVEAEGTRATGEAEGFSRTRTGAAGEVVDAKIELAEVRGTFESIKTATINRTLSRMTNPALSTAERAVLEGGIHNVRSLTLEVVSSNDILAEYKGNTVRVSTGLLNEIEARVAAMPGATGEAPKFLRSRILGLIFSHEASHSAGVRAERVADMEAIKVLEAAGLSRVGDANMPVTSPEIRAAVEAFDKPLGSSHIDNFFNRLRNLIRYGTTRGRVTNLENTARGEADKYSKYRRTDGTLKWKEMGRDGVLREGMGTAHFALALFLKEVATVAATGDRARIEEFFDGLMTTDFYVQYGLFVAGARVGEVAYTKYLQRFVKPKFLNGLMKTNLTLAAGIALPMIVGGHFEGKAFAITLGSLGLSTAAVRTGVSSLKWVTNLRKARSTGMLARMGLRAGKLSNVVGWVYTAAELAVILYVAEKIEHNVNARIDLAKARGELADAGRDWVAKVNDPNATDDDVKAANSELHDAWSGYRNYLYTPLDIDEAILASRLKGLARSAKIKADERAATIETLGRRPALKASIERRYGSLEAYADSRVKEEEGEVAKKLAMFTESYNINRDKHLEEVYKDHRRDTPFLGDVDDLAWNLAGGVAGADGDPALVGGAFGRLGRDRARDAFGDAIGESSRNRLESYDDEEALLRAMAKSLRDRDLDSRADVMDETLRTIIATRVLDRELINGTNTTIDTQRGTAEGAAEAVERIGDEAGE